MKIYRILSDARRIHYNIFNNCFDFTKPYFPFIIITISNNSKHFPIIFFYAAKTKNALHPYFFPMDHKNNFFPFLHLYLKYLKQCRIYLLICLLVILRRNLQEGNHIHAAANNSIDISF